MASGKVSKNLAIDIRANFVTRMRSIGMDRKMIQKLDLYLDVSMDDVNDRREHRIKYNNANG